MFTLKTKFDTLVNYIDNPTRRNFDAVATVFKADIHNIICSHTYEAEYTIFGDEISSETLIVLWKRLKDFKLSSDPKKAVGCFIGYIRNIVVNITKGKKSQLFKNQNRYASLDEEVDNSDYPNSNSKFEIPFEEKEFKRNDDRDFLNFLKRSLPNEKMEKDFEILLDSEVLGLTTKEICDKYKTSKARLFVQKHRIKEKLRSFMQGVEIV